MEGKTKIALLREHLKRGDSITGITAITLFNYYRLSDGIYKLRHKMGMNIDTEMVTTMNGSTYARYSLIK